jgi:serine/threonine protein kinase
LLLANGLSPIDWLNYEDGQLAPFSSKGWTAPEAYMGQPISQAMDVYSMAKLFLKLLPGTDFGEVSTFKSPTGGSDSQTLEFISEPKVFLDFNGWENTVSISPDGRETLCNVLERALSLDPLSRPSMKELASVCSTSVRVRKSVDKDDSHHFIVKIRNDHDTIHWI